MGAELAHRSGEHQFEFDQQRIVRLPGLETGLDFADYLIGVASTYEQGDASGFYIRNKYTGVFAQDTWQVRSNLTFNYGVRWDMLPPWREKYNQLQTFVLGPAIGGLSGRSAGMVFPGDRGVPNHTYRRPSGPIFLRASVLPMRRTGRASGRSA